MKTHKNNNILKAILSILFGIIVIVTVCKFDKQITAFLLNQFDKFINCLSK